MNICIFSGRTTNDAELRYTQGNNPTAVAKFSLATDYGYGDKKKTSFFNMTAFGKTAESIDKYVSKGTKILVQCHAQQDTWKDNNGNNRSAVGFIVDSWEFAQSAGEAKETKSEPKQGQTPDKDGFLSIPDGLDDELPFN